MKSAAQHLLLPALFLAGCSDSTVPEPVPEQHQQESDFLSVEAKEFVLHGRSSVTVEDDIAEEKRFERAKELIKLKMVAIGWFIDQTLQTLMEDQDEEKFEVLGFGAMVKTNRTLAADIKQINGTSFEFRFDQIIAGELNLPELLEVELGEEFSIEIGKSTNEQMTELLLNEEWYRQEPFDPWNPDKVPAKQKETLFLTITTQEPTADASGNDHR